MSWNPRNRGKSRTGRKWNRNSQQIPPPNKSVRVVVVEEIQMTRRIKDHDVTMVFWIATSLALILTFPIFLKCFTIFSGGEKILYSGLSSLSISIFIGLVSESFGSLILLNKEGRLRLKHILVICCVLGISILLGILINHLSEVLSREAIQYIQLLFWLAITIVLFKCPLKNKI